MVIIDEVCRVQLPASTINMNTCAVLEGGVSPEVCLRLCRKNSAATCLVKIVFVTNSNFVITGLTAMRQKSPTQLHFRRTVSMLVRERAHIFVQPCNRLAQFVPLCRMGFLRNLCSPAPAQLVPRCLLKERTVSGLSSRA